jgi:endonuclease-3
MEELHALPAWAGKLPMWCSANAFEINAGVVVDTHVQRLSLRLGLTKQTTPKRSSWS